MHQAEVVLRIFLCRRCWEHLKIRVGEASGLLPSFNASLGARCEQDAGLLGAGVAFGLGFRSLHVIASNLMLGAVPTLREGLVAADMPSLACLASFAALGVAPPRRTSTLADHVVEERGKIDRRYASTRRGVPYLRGL